MEEVKNIVAAYYAIKISSYIPRKGYERYGVYDIKKDPKYGKMSIDEIDADSIDIDRFESTLEHSGGVWVILRAIQAYFPDRIFSYWRDWEDIKDIAYIHDTGETQTGDICDDGTKEKTYDAIEREFVQKACEMTYGRKTAERLFQRFVEFQDRSTYFGQILYMADKLEAVLQGLMYEKMGRGRLNPETAKPLEMEAARFANTYNLADVWLYPLVLNAKKYEHFQLFLEIAITAGQMVRKTNDPFPWVKKMLK